MNGKKIVAALFVLGIVAGGAFWSGMQYQKSQAPARGNVGFMNGSNFAGRGMGAVRGGAGSFAAGHIVSAGAENMTIQTQNGSSLIVYFSTSTPIRKSASGSSSDLKSGADVLVAGTPNSDGSFTAKSIQIRPTGGLPGQNGASAT